MKHKLLSIAIWLNLIVTIPLIATEAFLRYVDYDGVYHYLSAWETLKMRYAVDGYRFETGHYNLGRWAVTIDNSGFRQTETKTSDCKVAFLGDSVTFGWGANDADTFVQLYANESPYTVLNRGLNGYNIGNLSELYKQLKADAIIYLVVSNDADLNQAGYNGNRTTIQSAIYYRLMWSNIVAERPKRKKDFDRYKRLFATMDRGDMLTIRLDDNSPFMQSIADIVPLRVSSVYPMVSLTDAHPNKDGHKMLYDAMRPYIDDFIAQRCHK